MSALCKKMNILQESVRLEIERHKNRLRWRAQCYHLDCAITELVTYIHIGPTLNQRDCGYLDELSIVWNGCDGEDFAWTKSFGKYRQVTRLLLVFT